MNELLFGIVEFQIQRYAADIIKMNQSTVFHPLAKSIYLEWVNLFQKYHLALENVCYFGRVKTNDSVGGFWMRLLLVEFLLLSFKNQDKKGCKQVYVSFCVGKEKVCAVVVVVVVAVAIDHTYLRCSCPKPNIHPLKIISLNTVPVRRYCYVVTVNHRIVPLCHLLQLCSCSYCGVAVPCPY